MSTYPTTLAGFKRFLQGGGAITLTSYGPEGQEMTHKYRGVKRTAEKVLTMTAKLTPGESWLAYGKAKMWSFDGNIATVVDDEGWHMTYEMELP